LVSGRTIDRDDPGTGLGLDRVRRETLAVGDVVDLDLLELHDPRQVQQARIDGAATVVVEFGVSDAGTVQFALEHRQLHGGTIWLGDPGRPTKTCTTGSSCEQRRAA